MISTLKNLLERAGIIKTEVVDEANTAERVGSWMEDETRSNVKRFDAGIPYVAGQYMIFGGILTEVLDNTLAGETPLTAPLKFSRNVSTDLAQLSTDNQIPASTGLVYKAIEQAKDDGEFDLQPAGINTAGVVKMVDPTKPGDAASTTLIYSAKGVNDVVDAKIEAKLASGGSLTDTGLIGRFDLYTDAYDVITHQLIVAVHTRVRPQCLLEGTGAPGAVYDWVTADPVPGFPMKWHCPFMGVLHSGRIRIKAADDTLGAGHSMSLFIPEVSIPELYDAEN